MDVSDVLLAISTSLQYIVQAYSYLEISDVLMAIPTIVYTVQYKLSLVTLR